MTRALVLSGGGARGAFQAGVLSNFLPGQVDSVWGSSCGAVNAALWAHDEDVVAQWRQLNSWRDIFSVDWRGLLHGRGVLNLTPLRRRLYNVLLPCDVTRTAAVSWFVDYTDLVCGQDTWSCSPVGSDTLPPAVVTVAASCAVPGLVAPVEGIYADGTVLSPAPLKAAIQGGVTKLYIVSTRPWGDLPGDVDSWQYRWAGPLLRAWELAETARLHDDIAEVLRVNGLITTFGTVPGRQELEVYLAAPPAPLPSTAAFNKHDIEAMIQLGKEALWRRL